MTTLKQQRNPFHVLGEEFEADEVENKTRRLRNAAMMELKAKERSALQKREKVVEGQALMSKKQLMAAEYKRKQFVARVGPKPGEHQAKLEEKRTLISLKELMKKKSKTPEESEIKKVESKKGITFDGDFSMYDYTDKAPRFNPNRGKSVEPLKISDYTVDRMVDRKPEMKDENDGFTWEKAKTEDLKLFKPSRWMIKKSKDWTRDVKIRNSLEARTGDAKKKYEDYKRLAGQRTVEQLMRKGELASEYNKTKHSLTKKTQFVDYNSAAWLLANFDFKKAHKKPLTTLRGNAKLWVNDFNANTTFVPSAREFGGFDPMLGLNFAGRSVSDKGRLMELLPTVRNPAIRLKLTVLFDDWERTVSNADGRRHFKEIVGSHLQAVARDFLKLSRSSNLYVVPKTLKDADVYEVQGATVSREPSTTADGGKKVSLQTRVGGIPVEVSLPPYTELILHFANDPDVSKGVVSVLCTIVSIHQCSSVVNVVTNIINCINSVFEDDVIPSFVRLVLSLLKKTFTDVVTTEVQAESVDEAKELEHEVPVEGDGDKLHPVMKVLQDMMSGTKEVSQTAMDSGIGSKLTALFSTLSVGALVTGLGVKMDAYEVSSIVRKYGTFFRGRDGFSDFISSLLGLLKECAVRIKNAIVNRDISELWGKDSFADWLSGAEMLLTCPEIVIDNARIGVAQLFQRKLKAGAYPSFMHSQLTPDQLFDFCQLHVENAGRFTKFFDGDTDPLLVKQVFLTINQLKIKLRELESRKANGQYRITPFFAMLVGSSGTGKTAMLDTIDKATSRALGLPHGPETVFNHIAGANFQDNLTSSSISCVIDDQDQKTGEHCYADETFVEAIIKFVNNKPLPIEKAAIEEKGKVFCNFVKVFQTTNYGGSQLQKMIKDKSVFWRRVNTYLEVFVQPKYANATGGLDMDKLDDSNDYWRFRYGVYDADLFDTQNPCKPPFKFVEYTSMSEMMIRMCKDCVAHIERERKLLAAKCVEGGDYCAVCRISLPMHPATPCVASEVQAEGAFDAAEANMSPGKKLGVWFLTVWFGVALLIPQQLFIMCFGGTPLINWRAIWENFKAINPVHETYRVAKGFYLTVADTVDSFVRMLKLKLQKAAMKVVALTLISSVGFVYAVRYLLKKYYTKPDVQSGRFELAGDLVQKPVSRDNYVRAQVVREPLDSQVHSTSSISDLTRGCLSLMVVVESNCSKVFGVRVKSNVIMFPSHVMYTKAETTGFAMPELRQLAQKLFKTELTFSKGPLKHTMVVTPGVNCVSVPGREMVLVRVPGFFPLGEKFDLLKHIPSESGERWSAVCDEGWVVRFNKDTYDTEITEAILPRLVVQNLEANKPMYQYDLAEKTKDGTCGSLLLCKVGNKTYIAGYHLVCMTTFKTLLNAESWQGLAEEFSAYELNIALTKLGEFCQLPGTPVLGTFEVTPGVKLEVQNVVIDPLPERSSLWVALTNGLDCVVPLGTLRDKFPLRGARSQCSRTMIAEDMKELEEEICGVSPNYVPPMMKGKMVDGEYMDPFTRAFKKYSNGSVDEEFVNLAIDDYCSGVDKIDFSKVRVLSDNEVITGVAGEVNPTNLKTSMGPPYFCKKEKYIEVVEEDGTRVSYLEEEFYRHIEEIEDCCAIEGQFYVPVLVHALKDEPVSVEKARNCDTRVFNVFPAAYNFLLKKYTATLMVTMHENWRFFENVAGKNINSLDCDLIIRHLSEVLDTDESVLMALFGDGDYKGFDVTILTVLMLALRKVIMYILDFTPLRVRHKVIIGNLLFGYIYNIRFVKNDLFMMCHSMGSGGYWTLDGNNIINSLLFRIAYYVGALELKIEVPKFRTAIAALFGGDDNIYGRSLRFAWFNNELLERVFGAMGMTYTATAKNGSENSMKSILECSFLKRHFYQEGGRWKARLEIKSLVKMLVCCKKSDLGRVDHIAVLVTNVNRELYFHGVEVFERWMVILDMIAEKYSLNVSKLYRRFSYGELDELYYKNAYPKWLLAERSALVTEMKTDLAF